MSKKISELPIVGSVGGTDITPVVQGGVTYSATLAQIAALASGGVTSVAGKTGVVTLVTADVAESTNLYYTDVRARLAHSATAPVAYDNTTGIISMAQSSTSVDGYLSAVDWTTFNGKASLASPAFTGVPTAPTAGVGTNTTQLATTAFVLSQGFSGASGSIPFAHASSTTAQTSATTTYVTAISTTITVTASSAPVQAIASGVFTVTTAVPTVMKVRVSINGVAGQEQLVSLTALTTNFTVTTQYISTALAAGTYTILFEFARNSGTGTVNFFEGTLDAIALQGANSNGITALTGLGLSAGPGSGSQAITGTLTMAGGGTNASLTAANGAIPYSTATALALLAPGTAGQVLRSGGAGAPTWTAQTYPASTTINQIMYSSAANVVTGLATANTGALVTSSTGVPSIVVGAASRVLRSNGTTVSFAQVVLTTDVTGTLPFAQGGTGATAFSNQRIPFSNGTIFTSDGNFIYDTTNVRFTVGGSGTARIGAVVASGSTVAMQAYSTGTNNAFQALNQAAYTVSLTSRQNNAVTGASIGMEFGRGTLATPLQALNGDQVGVIAAQAYTGTQTAPGYTGSISFILTEDAINTASGGEIVLATTPNTTLLPVERFRIKNSGETVFVNSHLRSTQTTAPTIAADAGAGTGASASVANATDVAGQITLTTGTLGISTGSYATVTFNKVYAVAPIVVLTPAGSTLSTSVYVTATTTGFSVSFAVAGGISTTYLMNYHIIETQ